MLTVKESLVLFTQMLDAYSLGSLLLFTQLLDNCNTQADIGASGGG